MKTSCCLTVLLLLLATVAQAQVSDRLAVEGLLAYADGAPVADGRYQVTFRLHDVDQDDAVTWQEVHAVDVNESRFTAALGAVEPLAVSSSGRYRFSAAGVDAEGIAVGLAGDDGLLILKAGTPSATISSPLANGIEVQGAEAYGLFVGRADGNGIQVESAGFDGVYVKSAGFEGIQVNSAGRDGLVVESAGNNGVVVERAGSPVTKVGPASPGNGVVVEGAENHGLYIGWAESDAVVVNTTLGGDGFKVIKAGAASSTYTVAERNGVEVGGAHANGLFVGQADKDGVQVRSAGNPSTIPNADPSNNGVEVRGAQGHGLFVGRADQNGIMVNSAGDIGIEVSGTTNEAAYFKRAINAVGTLRNHVVLIENTASSTDQGPDVLVLKSSAVDPTVTTNFISFYDGNDDDVGAIEGNSGGTGIAFKSGGADFAEYLPRLHAEEVLEAGDLVGVFAGHVTKTTNGAEQVMVVTGRAVVLGNMPPAEEEADYEAVAFVGQVPVRVVGPVQAGDFLVPSGREDGTARGVSPDRYAVAEGPVLGRALGSSSGAEVLALVGVDEASSLRQVVARQQTQIETQQSELEAQQTELDVLRRELAALRHLIEGGVTEARR